MFFLRLYGYYLVVVVELEAAEHAMHQDGNWCKLLVHQAKARGRVMQLPLHAGLPSLGSRAKFLASFLGAIHAGCDTARQKCAGR